MIPVSGPSVGVLNSHNGAAPLSAAFPQQQLEPHIDHVWSRQVQHQLGSGASDGVAMHPHRAQPRRDLPPHLDVPQPDNRNGLVAGRSVADQVNPAEC